MNGSASGRAGRRLQPRWRRLISTLSLVWARPARARRSVVYVIDALAVGGAQRHLVRLATGLQSEGWEVAVFCLSRRGRLVDELEAAGIPVLGTTMSWSASRLPLVVWDLYRTLTRLRPSIVHAYLPASSLLGALIARVARVPYVITSRRTVIKPGSWNGRAGQIMLTLTRWCSTLTVAVSDAARDNLLAEGASPARVITVPNGVVVPDVVPASRGVFAASPVVGATGTLWPAKGNDVLIRAFAPVAAEFPTAQLVLVGDGADRPMLEALVTEAGLESRVRFLGEVSNVGDVLPEFDVFCLPSRREGMPNGLLEAMAYGLPSVASDVGGVREIVTDGVNGLLVPSACEPALTEAIARLLRHPEEARAMGERGRLHVQKEFSVENERRRTVAVYDMVLGGAEIHPAGSRDEQDGASPGRG